MRVVCKRTYLTATAYECLGEIRSERLNEVFVLQGFCAAVDKSTAHFAGADTCGDFSADNVFGKDYVLDYAFFSADRDFNLFSLGDIADEVARAVIPGDCLRCLFGGYCRGFYRDFDGTVIAYGSGDAFDAV